MDESEKLAVSKKAYAEIILNTSREAAARVMVTERKSKRYQQELLAAKGESLHMLSHMKQTMDYKLAEAEKKSLSEQQKIEELEAQLNEAEDIVRDLRDELREVQYALEKIVRNNQSRSEEPKVNVYKATGDVEFQEQPGPVITFVENNLTLNSRNGSTCQNSDNLHLKNQLVANPDFASITTMNKEPELLRKCTREIRAFETTVLDRKTLMHGHVHDQVVERRLPSVPFSLKTYLHPVNNQCGDPIKIIDKKADGVDNEILVRESEKSWSIKHVLNADSYQSVKVPDGSNSLRDPTDPESRSPSCYQSCAAEKNKKSGFVDVIVGKMEVLKSCDARQMTKNDNPLTDKVELSTQENGSTETSADHGKTMNVTSKSDVNKIDETKKVTPTQPTNERVIMYTFQRKRKKESLSSPDGSATATPEDGNIKRRKEDESLSSQDSEKSSLINESTRDSRRLAQVARQLISLSEKKWWQ